MNKFKLYTLALGLLSLGACQDSFLETEPLTEVTDANFYKTPDDAYKALVGCYDGLPITKRCTAATCLSTRSGRSTGPARKT